MAGQCVSDKSEAERRTLLGDVIAGRTTFRESLDDIVSQLKDAPATATDSDKERDKELLARFKGFVTLVDALGGYGLDTAALLDTAVMMDNFKYVRASALKNAGLATATGLLAYVPVVGLPSLLASSWYLVKFFVCGFATTLAAEDVKHPEKALAPLYAAADSLDAAGIDSSYVFNLFTPARPRFESAYAALPAGGREQVDSRLYRLLGAGGIPGMDERQLKKYLTVLAENAPQALEVERREAALGDDAEGLNDKPDDNPDDECLGVILYKTEPPWSRK